MDFKEIWNKEVKRLSESFYARKRAEKKAERQESEQADKYAAEEEHFGREDGGYEPHEIEYDNPPLYPDRQWINYLVFGNKRYS